MSSVVLLFSGGLDSTVALTYYLKLGWDVTALTFRYPSKHNNAEQKAAMRIVAYYWDRGIKFNQLRWEAVKVPKKLFEGAESSLLTGTTGGTSMIVPGRNLLFIAMANVIAVSRGIPGVAIATNLSDPADFPDCTPDFLNSADGAMGAGYGTTLLFPFGSWAKYEIVKRGAQLGAPMQYSWSCYKEGPIPCGACPACKLRSKAFAFAGEVDDALHIKEV